MKYAKPSITSYMSALEVVNTVQLNKASQLYTDVHIQNDPVMSAGAYEADE